MPKRAHARRRRLDDLLAPVGAGCSRLVHLDHTCGCDPATTVNVPVTVAPPEPKAPAANLPDLSAVPLEVVTELNGLVKSRPAVLDILVDTMRAKGVAALTDPAVLAEARMVARR